MSFGAGVCHHDANKRTQRPCMAIGHGRALAAWLQVSPTACGHVWPGKLQHGRACAAMMAFLGARAPSLRGLETLARHAEVANGRPAHYGRNQ